jgi:fucose 4-O-acetylase-like acetyltransferase
MKQLTQKLAAFFVFSCCISSVITGPVLSTYSTLGCYDCSDNRTISFVFAAGPVQLFPMQRTNFHRFFPKLAGLSAHRNRKFMQLDGFISQKFRFWSFVSMVLLVFVHGYNLNMRYMQPWTIPGEPLSVTSFTEYFLANGIFRFRIPMLFIISGFLYAWHDQRPNRERIRKRLRTLLLPYLLWSAIAILYTLLLECFPASRSMVADSGIVQIDDTRKLLHDYHWYEMLGRWLLVPVPYQLWFIRVLLIYNLAYTGIRWCVTHPIWRWVFFGLAFLLWMGTIGLHFIEGEGLLFFALGVWIQKSGFRIDQPPSALKPAPWGLVFVLTAALKTILAFYGKEWFGDAIFPILSLMHKVVIFSGLISCWYGLNPLVRFFMEQKWFLWISAFSFMIYAVHAPLVAYLITPSLHLLASVPHGQIL